MGYPWRSRIEHVNFGMVLGMSTRKGTVVFLDDILNEAKDVMHEQMKSNSVKYAGIEDPEYVSDTLGITAVKIQDMAAKRFVFHFIFPSSLPFFLAFEAGTDRANVCRIGNYKFEWKRMTSFEGDTGQSRFSFPHPSTDAPMQQDPTCNTPTPDCVPSSERTPRTSSSPLTNSDRRRSTRRS